MKPRLLLLEDDPASRHFLCLAAEALPAAVDHAGTVAEARSLALATDHALWLFDVNLPDGSGGALLAALRTHGLHTPALAHTAAHDEAERQRLLGEGFAAVVTKPLSAAAWQAAIREALAGRDAAAPQPPQARDASTAALWDDAGAAAALGGSTANIAALRQLFLAELPATRAAVTAAAAAGDGEAMRAELHRLRAGCGFVGAAGLRAAATRLHDAPGSEAALQEFVGILERTAASAASD
ncbi:response regulator [Luteimonas sp. RD2P54]|uniref:Response regulator n=1 Tax=Luteimonas endophytica TaxID=3042023 RepID=A0ABT6JCA5_9GAMM|nr:hybrid sensor histidine kinase/response regulator [Luteimonas endophytica]MDH5824469.1 response regulator [Luteimonas endophytica]